MINGERTAAESEIPTENECLSEGLTFVSLNNASVRRIDVDCYIGQIQHDRRFSSGRGFSKYQCKRLNLITTSSANIMLKFDFVLIIHLKVGMFISSHSISVK